MTGSQLTRLAWRLTWLVLIVLSAYYLYRAVNYRFLTPSRLGPDLFNKQLWYFAHLIVALPALVGAPLQFISSLRSARLNSDVMGVTTHRRSGVSNECRAAN